MFGDKEMKNLPDTIREHMGVVESLLTQKSAIEAIAQVLINCVREGAKILICGNGGSAADAQHIAAELVVRYAQNRRAIAAIALTTDSSVLTANSNDFDFSTVFSRQVEALGKPGDCLIAISTSGNSRNIINAARLAREKEMHVVSLCGGGELAEIGDAVVVQSSTTARIQEAHLLVAHWWCEKIEEAFCADE